MASASSNVVCPENGRAPASISCISAPNAQTSAVGFAGAPFRISGAMYGRVPATPRVCADSGDRVSDSNETGSSMRARPKSSSFTVPAAITITFSPLRSPWTMPRACACARAAPIGTASRRTSFSGIRPWESCKLRGCPSTSSIAMNGVPSTSPAS